MQRLHVSGAVRPIYGSLGVKRLTTHIRLKNKACSSPYIKTLQQSHELQMLRPQTQHSVPEHKHLKFPTQLTPSADKTANLCGFERII